MTELRFDRTLLAGLRKRYPGKIVAFDSEFGVICVRKDTQKAFVFDHFKGAHPHIDIGGEFKKSSLNSEVGSSESRSV